jgi:hypothetical protein
VSKLAIFSIVYQIIWKKYSLSLHLVEMDMDPDPTGSGSTSLSRRDYFLKE